MIHTENGVALAKCDDCPWEAAASSEAQAAVKLAKHRCRRPRRTRSADAAEPTY